MNSPEIEDFEWLLDPAAGLLLSQAQQEFSDGVNVVRIAKSLRKQTTSTRSAIIMEQAQLRLRGRLKFEQADEMFFTRRGLEQATSERIARYKAQRFAGAETVADICCGIGGDLIGLLGREGATHTIGVETDPITSLFADHNGRRYHQSESNFAIYQQTFESFDPAAWAGLHFDPDRRTHERTVHGSRFSPPLPEIFSRLSNEQKVGIKVAPATPTATDWPTELEREWIGDRRECKQQIIWSGQACQRPGARTATVIDGSGVHQLHGDDESTEMTIEVARKIKRYLYEPHAAILAAGLTNELATQCGIGRMAADIEYLTSTKRRQHPMLAVFEVVESFPLDLKRASNFLAAHSIGIIEVKNRGASKIIFDRFERMKLSGEHRATVILTRIGLQQWVAICRRTPTDFPV